MIPGQIAPLIKASLATIQETAISALRLISGLEIAQQAGGRAGTFFRFINAWVRGNPDSDRTEAAEMYRAATFWQSQGSILSEWPDNIPLDARLARDIIPRGRYMSEYDRFRYHVTATVTDPATGKSVEKGIFVPSDVLLSPQELYSYAEPELRTLLRFSPGPSGSSQLEDYTVSYRIYDFGRFV